MASPGHGGAWRFNLKREKQEFSRLTVLIRRGGRGAARGAAKSHETGFLGTFFLTGGANPLSRIVKSP